jgi:hypothetical protein
MRFAIVEISSGRICDKLSSDRDRHQEIQAQGGCDGETRYLRIPDGADENHLLILSAEDGTKYIEEDEDAKVAEQWASLRKERDARLAACDWTQSPDSPLSPDKKSAWASYRHDLRELPAVEGLDPASPTWPSQPA